jgi:hypothetical protein
VVFQQNIVADINKEDVQLGAAYLAWAGLMMIVAYNLLRESNLAQLVNFLAWALVLGAIAVTGLELWLRFVLRVQGDWGGMTQYNNYGDYLSLGLVSALYLWLKSGRLACAAALGGLFIVVGLSLSPSRSVWLYWLVLVLVAGIGGVQQKRRLFSGLGVLLLVYAGMQFLWKSAWMPVAVTTQTAGERFVQQVSGASPRLHIWRVAWDLFLQSPWFGQGFGRFDWAYFAAGDGQYEIINSVENGHNIILHLLAEMGVFPVLCLFATLGVWGYAFIKSQPSLEKSWLMALISILALHSLLEYPLWYCYFLGIAAVLLGVGEQKAYPLKVNRLMQWSLASVLAVFIGVSIQHRLNYMRMENAMYSMQFGNQKLSMPVFVNVLKSVSQATPTLAPFVAMVFSLIGENNTNPSDTMLLIGDKALHFRPYPALIYKQVVRLAVAGKQPEATALLRQSLKAYPARTADYAEELQTYTPAAQQKVAYLLEIIQAGQGH